MKLYARLTRNSVFKKIAIAGCAVALTAGCASYLKYQGKQPIESNKEFEDHMTVQELPVAAPIAPPTVPEHATSEPPSAATPAPSPVEVPKAAKAPTKETAKKSPGPIHKRQPEVEDDEGFAGRRPIVDPFRVGEKIVLDVSYFGVSAGDMTLEVKPFVAVNGKTAYRFLFKAITSTVFGAFYKVDDWGEAFVDYHQLIPYSYSLHVKETAQLREVRNYFDWSKMRSFFWEKKITKKWGEEEKKEEWEILPYSQNIFSAPMYLRTFSFKPGKKYAVRVSHEGKNFVTTSEVVRQEVIDTPLGKKNCHVLKMEIQLGGVFQPVGDIFFWLTADDRKFIVRIESKIKIGKIVAMVKEMDLGKP